MITRLTALTLALSTLSNASFGEGQANLITIRGLNVDSSIQKIEDLLGTCVPDTEIPFYFSCDIPLSGYGIDETGRVTEIAFPCDLINGCEYSEKDLADLLSDSLGLSEPYLLQEDKSQMGIHGDAGDRLIIGKYRHGYIVSIVAYNYRKPTLNLD